MSLAAWQARLQSHFEQLREQRPSDIPIFGLEHGLEPSDLDELEDGIRTHIAHSPPSNDHSLAWVVYASEFGYRYAGDEYWQTFEKCTPGWETRGDRYWIRRCFRDFSDRFGGAKPSGPWAYHFSIICWPITHAILPRDLQRHLARILYDLRHVFSPELIASPALLGERIAAASWNTSSRFQDFAQQPLLVGQIAAALLFQEEQFSGTLILPATLARMAADLDQERRARAWLRSAKSAARQVRLWGLRRPGGPAAGPRVAGDEWREQVKGMAIEPRLVLRPRSDSLWDIRLEIPDLNPLLLRLPHLSDNLKGSRCIVTGSASRSPLARGRILCGSQRVILQDWPSPAEVLLRFEQSSPELEYLLKTECLLRPGPAWLFRIQSDGCAYEVRSKVVRPGENYILLSSAGPIQAGSVGAAASVTCSGVYAARLDPPATITGLWRDVIEALGLQQARSLRVWPAGLPAADWDGEGRGEWLFPDRPRIAIRVDHAVDSILLRLDGNESQALEVAPAEPGSIAFVELPTLAPGAHTLCVSVRSALGELGDESGLLDLIVREPRPWRPGLNHQSPFVVVVDPPTPSLEQLWEGAARIDIHGPAGRQSACSISLFDKLADRPFVREALPPLRLPVEAATWRRHFEEHVRDVGKFQNAYDRARLCQIDFDAAELGRFSLECQREFTPVRWVLHRRAREYMLTLVDDSGSGEAAEVSTYGFEAPETPVSVESSLVSRGLRAPKSGGMYVARVGECCLSVVVPPEVRTITDLRVDVQFQDRPRSPSAISEAISILELWCGARLPGHAFALIRRQNVVNALLCHIFNLICGERWSQAELEVRNDATTESLRLLARAVSDKRHEQEFVAVLERECSDLAAARTSERVARVWTLAAKYLLIPDRHTVAPQNIELSGRWLIGFALRLASCPESLRSWSGGKSRAGLQWLLEVPVLARAARFLVLAIDACSQPQPLSVGSLYNGWEWEWEW